MSVYITIKNAEINKSPKHECFAVIQSETHAIKTEHVPPASKIEWIKTSLVAKIREESLDFKVCEDKKGSYDLIGEGRLEFTDFEYCPYKDFPHTLKLKKGNKEVGVLNLNIYYNEKKNYIGNIEFYEMENSTMSTLRFSNLDRVHGGQIPRERVIFYKGPCKHKNAFSCLDQQTKSEQFEVVEEHYREVYEGVE